MCSRGVHRLLTAGGFISALPAAVGCHRPGQNDHAPEANSAAISADSEEETYCFEAVGDGAKPAQPVFDELGRPGNGETWLAILEHAVRERAKLGEVVIVSSMGFGVQYAAEFENRKTWVGFDAEAGGAVFCTGDVSLFTSTQQLYEAARRDPQVLRQLIASVPPSAWDD